MDFILWYLLSCEILSCVLREGVEYRFACVKGARATISAWNPKGGLAFPLAVPLLKSLKGYYAFA